MKKNLAAYFILVPLVLLVVSLAPSVRATTATWTNGATGNAWETAGNWDINQVPNNNTFDVSIPIAAACNFSSDFQIGALNLSVTSAKLNLVPGSRLVIDSATGVNNNGTIVVNTTGANNTTNLRFDVSCPIAGTGSILLKVVGTLFNVANFDLSGHTVTIGAAQTLHGDGTVFSNGGLLINNGTINGDDASGTMQLDFTYNDGVLHKNNGTIKATNGGMLGLYSGIVDQSGGGSFLADGTGSVVQFGGTNNGGVVGATIIGGTLNTSNGGIIQIIGGNGALLTSSTNNGAIQIPPGNNPLLVSGTGLTNNGTILVNTTGANSTSKILFQSDGTLGGTGSVKLNGIGTAFNIADLDLGGHTVTIGTNQTIHGLGTILNGGILINNGTINGDDAGGGSMQLDLVNNSGFINKNNGTINATNGGVLGLYSGVMDQTGGGSFLADGTGSMVQLGGGGIATVIGGTLNTANNGIIQIGGAGALLTSSTNNGAIQVTAGNNPLFVNGTGLTNNGTILVNTTAANSTTVMQFTADGTLNGTGSVTLNGIIGVSNVADFDCNGHNITNGSNHTIKGNGDITTNGGILTNNGTIAPGTSAGQLNVSGNLVLGSTSNLAMEIGGTTPATQYDVLNKGGSLTLNGTLNVRLINSFTPAASHTFTIVTTQAALAGAFTNVASGQRLNTADGVGSFIVTYSGNNVVLSNFAVTPPPSTPSPTPTPTPSPTSTPTATPTSTPTATPTATATSTPTPTATATPTSTPAPTPTSTPTPTPTAAPSQLLNIATRLRVQTGENVLIGGFIITGTDPKKVIVRAIGPSLAQFFNGALVDTTLELHSGNGALLASNDNWKTRPDGSSQQAEIEATTIPPSNDLESAIVITLPANNAGYTAIVRGKGDTTGIGVVEAYDLNQTANSKLGNIATRGFVDTGDNVMIGGLIIGGGGGGNGKVVVRAIGPTLGNFGINGALQDPTLELHDGNGMLLVFNNNWQDDASATEVQANNLAPNDPRESAVLRSLPPGAYTAIVRGNGSTTGVGLVEVYNIQ
jgi:hypothetical protein